jgi:hypothetical protein
VTAVRAALRPGPWAPLWAAAAAWPARLPAIAAALGELPGDERWRTAVVARGRALAVALASGDRARSERAAMELAGLGEGSTPAGDDYLMGSLHAAWAADLPARRWASAVVAAAAPRTTTLSAGWLEAAARGAVGAAWRVLLAALPAGDEASVRAATLTVRALGHTSGAYSLRGFLDTNVFARAADPQPGAGTGSRISAASASTRPA